jgi:hypothetical protein
MGQRKIDWVPAEKPFGYYSFIPPVEDIPDVDGRRFTVMTDAKGRPIWVDKDHNYWAGPWPAEV